MFLSVDLTLKNPVAVSSDLFERHQRCYPPGFWELTYSPFPKKDIDLKSNRRLVLRSGTKNTTHDAFARLSAAGAVG
jgi:hypothetical protein